MLSVPPMPSMAAFQGVGRCAKSEPSVRMNRPTFDFGAIVTGVSGGAGAAASSVGGSGVAGACATIRTEDMNPRDTTTTIRRRTLAHTGTFSAQRRSIRSILRSGLKRHILHRAIRSPYAQCPGKLRVASARNPRLQLRPRAARRVTRWHGRTRLRSERIPDAERQRNLHTRVLREDVAVRIMIDLHAGIQVPRPAQGEPQSHEVLEREVPAGVVSVEN